MFEHDVPSFSSSLLSSSSPFAVDSDTPFRGENWFFYWKISSSLWREKIGEIPSSSVILPLNWAFHSDTGESYDFARSRPETDLKKLSQTIIEMGKRPLFFLPLGPCPFLPHGGVPLLLARETCLNEDLRPRAFVGSHGELQCFSSFFDPRILKAFSRFVRVLGQMFSQRGVEGEIFGFEPGHLTGEGFRPYLFDYSKAFEESFFQYSKGQEREGREAKGEDFRDLVAEFYVEEAQNALLGHWSGHLKIAFLGGERRGSLLAPLRGR